MERGDVLTTPDWLRPTTAVDVKIRLLPDVAHALRHNTEIAFHSAAFEATGRVRLLEKEKLEPGEESWAQVALSRPAPLVKGDLFIIRSPTETLGGGEIVDTYPRRHRRYQATIIKGLEAREKGSAREILLATLEAKEPLDMEELAKRCGMSLAEAGQTVKSLAADGEVVFLGEGGSHALLFSGSGWSRLTEKATQLVAKYHRQFPLRPGMPKEELKSKLTVPAGSLNAAMQQMVKDGALAEVGKSLRLPAHRTELNREQKALAETYLRALNQSPYSPPGDLTLDPELLELLLEERQVVRVAENVVFPARAYDEMVQKVTGHIKAHGKITVAEVRDMFQTSRKYALALMEHLDEQKITRRTGDERVLR